MPFKPCGLCFDILRSFNVDTDASDLLEVAQPQTSPSPKYSLVIHLNSVGVNSSLRVPPKTSVCEMGTCFIQ